MRCWDPDLGFGAFSPLDLGSGFGIRDGKKSGSGSWMNIPDYFSERLETDFCVKNTVYLNSLMRIRDLRSGILSALDPGSGMEKIEWYGYVNGSFLLQVYQHVRHGDKKHAEKHTKHTTQGTY